jgi:hypothetical protein
MWIPKTGRILTCGFQEPREIQTCGFQAQVEIPTCGFQEEREIEHMVSENRGNSNLWISRTGGIF